MKLLPIVLGIGGITALYLLTKSSTVPIVTTTTTPTNVTGSTSYISQTSKVSTYNSSGQYVEASQYVMSPGYTLEAMVQTAESLLANGQKYIMKTIPSYASAGSDPAMKVVQDIGGGSHLVFTPSSATNATRQASALYLASYDPSYVNTDAYKKVMGFIS